MSARNVGIDASNVKSKIKSVRNNLLAGSTSPSDALVDICDGLIDLASALDDLCDEL